MFFYEIRIFILDKYGFFCILHGSVIYEVRKEFSVTVVESIRAYKKINKNVENVLQNIVYDISGPDDELIDVLIKEIGDNQINITETCGDVVINIITKDGEKELAKTKNGRLRSLCLYETTQVGDDFMKCINDLNVFKAKKLQRMGKNCFCVGACNSCLTEIDLPELKKIGSFCFSSRVGFEKLNLPKLQEMGQNCFYSADALKVLELPELQIMEKCCFFRVGSLEKVVLSKLEDMYQRCFYDAAKLKLVNLSSLCRMDDGCFGGNVLSLEIIKLPKLEKMGNSCFKNCINLITMYIPKLQKIGDGCFDALTKLKKTKIVITNDMPGCIKKLLIRHDAITDKIKSVVENAKIFITENAKHRLAKM